MLTSLERPVTIEPRLIACKTICTGLVHLYYETVHNLPNFLCGAKCCFPSTAIPPRVRLATVDAHPREVYSRLSAPFPTQLTVAGAVRL